MPAATLLWEAPRTACFAPGANPGTWTVEELCRRTVETLQRAGASFHQWRVAGVVAVLQKRYKELMRAMQEVRIKPLVCEELVQWGEDNYRRGLRRGRSQGLKQARETLLNILEARSIPLSKADQEKILREPSLQRLLGWIQRTVSASSAAEVFSS